MDIKKILGLKIKRLRLKHNLTQEQLAEKMQIAPRTLCGIENGENSPKPTPLCYWCAYNEDTPHGDKEYKGMCKYNSLWTPTNNNFSVKNSFGLEKKEEITLVS